MKSWEQRPREFACLLNPAFCGMISLKGIGAYQNGAGHGAPYVFPFLLLPLVLHKPTRDSMPRSFRRSFLDWILDEGSADIRFSFAGRAKKQLPFVREGLLFAFRHARLSVTADGLLCTHEPERKSRIISGEVVGIFQAAEICGRHLAYIDDMATIMSVLGVRP